tara:strand:+ start:1382 stop:2269 length:888 start_codon:yes stop_codon:yes gene_type:complete
MLRKNTGALPAKTKKTYSFKEIAEAKKLTNHYLNHKKSDTDGWHDLNNKKKRDGRVIDGIIHCHSTYYTGDYNYSDKYQDLVGQAYLIVHEAALDYVKRTEEFHSNFAFCKFASNKLKWGLKKYIYELNTKRLNGSLPDSDYVRKLYYKLPKEKKSSSIEKISNDLNLDVNIVKKIDNTFRQTTISGDMPLKDNNEPIQKSIFETLSDENQDIEQKIIDKDLNHKSKKIIQKFLKKTPLRDKEIFTSIKLEESKNTKELAKKYKISSERVRQIAEEKFEEIKRYLKNNLENQTTR